MIAEQASFNVIFNIIKNGCFLWLQYL